MATEALPRTGPITSRRPELRALRPVVGGVGLAGTVACGLVIAVDSLAGPSRLLAAYRDGEHPEPVTL